jgi:hypothetical protein
MCELLPRLFDCQDAPDISALAVPPFRILLRRRGARVVALATMVRSPFLHAGGDPLGLPGVVGLVPLDLRLWAGDPAPFGVHRCPCSTVEADMETPEISIPRTGDALADTGWHQPLRHPDHPLATWGWRAPSRGLMTHLVKRLQCNGESREE